MNKDSFPRFQKGDLFRKYVEYLTDWKRSNESTASVTVNSRHKLLHSDYFSTNTPASASTLGIWVGNSIISKSCKSGIDNSEVNGNNLDGNDNSKSSNTEKKDLVNVDTTIVDNISVGRISVGGEI